MGSNLKSVFLGQISVLFLVVLLIFGCASIQKPMGGPRDRTPPKLLLATPLNQTRNFKATSIKLDFDEYFKLSSTYTEIVVSPSMDKLPEFKTKGKSLIINFKDTLQKNTTYVINFGKAIVDVNEGNVLKNFTYVFSTGPHIDSLSVSGTVMNTQTQEKEKDATVMLFPLKQDSAMYGKKKPSIFATTDSAGNFTLGNLHDGDYRIYALKEQSPNKIYDNENELIAFLKSPIHLTKDTSNIKLSLFKQTDKFRADAKFNTDGSLFFTFNMPLNNPEARINFPPDLDKQKIVDFSRTKDTASIYLRNMNFDSISVSFIDNGKVLDTISRKKALKETYTRVINPAFNLTTDNKLKPGSDLNITMNTPIESIDVSRVTFLEDSMGRTNFTMTADPANPKKFNFKYRWKDGAAYQLVFNEGTFTNIYGDRNKRVVRNFRIDKPENYGNILFDVTVPDTSKTYVVELLNEAKRTVHSDIIKKNTTLTYKNYPTVKYRVRIIYDTNGNGRWDSGNVKQKLYPENIILLPDTYTIRPNWDNRWPVDIPKEVIAQ